MLKRSMFASLKCSYKVIFHCLPIKKQSLTTKTSCNKETKIQPQNKIKEWYYG